MPRSWRSTHGSSGVLRPEPTTISLITKHLRVMQRCARRVERISSARREGARELRRWAHQMHKGKIRSFAAALVMILFTTAAARADTVAGVTSLGALSANDTIVWSQLGVDATDLTTTPPFPAFTSTHGLTGTVSLAGSVGHSLVAVVCPETLCS